MTTSIEHLPALLIDLIIYFSVYNLHKLTLLDNHISIAEILHRLQYQPRNPEFTIPYALNYTNRLTKDI